MNIVHHADSNRIGILLIPYESLANSDQWPMLLALLGNSNQAGVLTVIDEHPHESGRGMSFVCTGQMFQPLTEGDAIPEYRVECARNMAFENPEREASRHDNGEFGFSFVRQNVIRVPAASAAFHPHVTH